MREGDLVRFSDDTEKYHFIQEKLYTAVLSDVMDTLGLKDRAMEANIRPIHPDSVMVGKARTMLWMEVYEVYEHPYKVEIEAIDSLKPGDVAVQCTGGSQRNAPWGALMTTAAMARGARGAVVDAYVRDVKKIVELGFPVFAAGIRPLDSKGRGYLVDYDCPIECGGVAIKTGDLVFADYDGVVVVPHEAEEEALTLAVEKVDKENLSFKELKEGRFLRDVYAKYRVL
jgi:regulator of RNase E activity RraA